MMQQIIDYVRGTHIMENAWPEGTETNKYGDRQHEVALGDPDFVHATSWIDYQTGKVVTAKDDSLYKALGVVQYATGGFLLLLIGALLGSA